MILNLLREHGRRLNFLGVILQRTEFKDELGKQAMATGTSQIAKLMGADGAIITRTVTSGNAFIDVMLTVQACERKGVKTVFLTPEWGGKDGNELPLLFYVPEAIAMVSTGSFEHEIKLGIPNKVIGVDDEAETVRYAPLDEPYSPWSELRPKEWGRITGSIDWWGNGKLTCKTY